MRASALLSIRIIGDGTTSADGPAKPAAAVTTGVGVAVRWPLRALGRPRWWRR